MAHPEGRWLESLSSINTYVKDLNVEGSRVTVAVFDDHPITPFQIIRHSALATGWIPITADEVQPRGGTPLLDSIMKMVHGMEFVNDPKSVLIVVTDGGENSSRNATKASVKAQLDKIRSKDWQVLFIGADFDAFADAAAVGVGWNNTLRTSMGNYNATMNLAALKSQAYAECGASMGWTEADRKTAVGDK